jgi:hypothetical protein
MVEPKEESRDVGVRVGRSVSVVVGPGPLRLAFVASAVVAALMVVQSVSGILVPGVYRDVGFALDAWRVNDPVTLVVATPVALAALVLAWRGSLRALLVLLGTMQYALYNYAFYLFGAALNVHFLLYVAAFLASGVALIAGFVALDPAALARALGSRLPARPLAAYLGVWAAALGVAWVGQALAFALTGVEPELGAEAFRLIAALDLALVVAPAAVAGAWLWRRRPWGVVVAVVLHVKGAIYALLLAIGSVLGGPVASGGGDGLLGLWLFFAIGSTVSLVVLLTNLRAVDAAAAAIGRGRRPSVTPPRDGPQRDVVP